GLLLRLRSIPADCRSRRHMPAGHALGLSPPASCARDRPKHEAAMRLRMRLAPATAERAGPRIRHLIPPRAADAMIAGAGAAPGRATRLGARAHAEQMPPAAIPV